MGASLCGGTMRNLGGSIYQEFYEYEGSGRGASLSVGDQLGEQKQLTVGAPLGNLAGCSLTGISSHRGPAGEHVRGLVYWGLSEKGERGPRDGASHSEEAQREGLLYWGPRKICLKRLWVQESP
jgi:hypothetical protein